MIEYENIHLVINKYCGYRLIARPIVWDFNYDEIKAMSNGCGPDGWKGDIIPDNLLGICFTPACDIHDVEYKYGTTKEHKTLADKNLITNMLTINEVDSKFFIFKFIRRKIILTYYEAVADLGSVFFWKDKDYVDITSSL